VEVVLVPVGDHDPGKVREDPGVLHRVRLRAPSQNAEYSPVKAPWTYFLPPAGPDRSVVSSNPATGAAVIRARISPTTSAARDAAFARQEWMKPSETARR
jgi:hypothetical protein